MEESPKDLTTLHPVYDDVSFSLQGIGSGNDRVLTWSFTGEDRRHRELPDELYKLEKDEEVYGEFTYKQV